MISRKELSFEENAIAIAKDLGVKTAREAAEMINNGPLTDEQWEIGRKDWELLWQQHAGTA